MAKFRLNLLALLICVPFLNTSAFAEELIVDLSGADGAFTSIGAAIQEAADGDVIVIRPGRYEESLNIDKQLTLQGSGIDTTELVSLFSNAIVLSSSKPVSIRNLLISAGEHGILAPVDPSIIRDHTENDSRFVNIENCFISDCSGSGVRIETGGTVLVRNSIITRSGQSGITFRGLVPSETDSSVIGSSGRRQTHVRFPTNASIVNSVFDGNGSSGISIWNLNGGVVTVASSIITNNGGWGIDNYTRGLFATSNDLLNRNYPDDMQIPFQPVRVTYSCVWNNQVDSFPRTYGDGVVEAVLGTDVFEAETEQNIFGNGVIEEDPLIDNEYRLLPDSPAIDAGDPSSTQNDPDGSPNNMGAFGGPGAANWILGQEPSIPGPGNGEFVQPVLTPTYVNNFNGSSASENGLLIAPPGQPGEFDLASAFFNLFTTGPDDVEFTDGFGMSINLTGGDGATVYGTPIEVGDDFVYVRVSVRSTGNAVLALGGLDAQPADNLAGAALDGSLGVNFMVNASRFVDRFGLLEALYKPERGAIVPVIQATAVNDEQVTIQFDNLEIYRISQDILPSFGNDNGATQASAGSFRIGDTVIWSSK